ncbi:MAG TPA: hypothetical protein PLQ67_01110 [Burkholderiaceae bacterium]|nr:hypothetical protein [Burkholderiaceae bacterium]
MAVLPLHGSSQRFGMRLGGNHPTERFASGWFMTDDGENTMTWRLQPEPSQAQLPQLRFHTIEANEHKLEMQIHINSQSNEQLAHIVAQREDRVPSRIHVSFKQLAPMPTAQAAELLARFLGHTDGFLPRQTLTIETDHVGHVKNYQGPSFLDDIHDPDTQSQLIFPSDLLQKTLSYLGYGVSATHREATHFKNGLTANAFIAHQRTPPQYFSNGLPGSGPGLNEPRSFGSMAIEPIELIPTVSPRELKQQGANKLAFGIPSAAQDLRTTFVLRRGIHTDLLHNQDALSAGHIQNEALELGRIASDVRYISLDSGHYRPHGAYTTLQTAHAFDRHGLDAQGRVLTLFYRLGGPISSEPFATLTLKRRVDTDGTHTVEAYIPKRRDPNPSEPRFIPHFRAQYIAGQEDTVHIKTLDLADFPPTYLAAFLAQSLKAHGLSPTRQLSIEGLYAYQLTDEWGHSLQQQVIAALSVLGIRVKDARFEPDLASNGLRVTFVVETHGKLAPDEFNSFELTSAKQADIPSRAYVTTPQSELTALALSDTFSVETDPFREPNVRVTPHNGKQYITFDPMELGKKPVIVSEVDRHGTMHLRLPRAQGLHEEMIQQQVFTAAAQRLNDSNIQVNTIRQQLFIGSTDPLARLFIERARHHHHQQGKDLNEAARAAAADVINEAPLTAQYQFLELADIHIFGNWVVIDAQRTPTALPRISLTTAHRRPTKTQDSLNILRALVGEHPEVLHAKQRLYQALKHADDHRFRYLAAHLAAEANTPISQLAGQLNVQLPKLQNTLTHLTAQLMDAPAVQFKDVKGAVERFLQPLLAPGQTPAQYVANLAADPTAWALSEGLAQRIPSSRLEQLDQSELKLLQNLAEHSFSAKALLIGEGSYQRDLLEKTNQRARQLRATLHPTASTWHEVGLAYRGGLAQLVHDATDLLARRQAGQVRHINFPILWRDSSALNLELLAAKAPNWQQHTGDAHTVSAKLNPLHIRSLTHTHPEAAHDDKGRSISALDEATLDHINQLRAQWGDPAPINSSVRIGPQAHHALYFGPKLTLNARIINELEATRRTISDAMGKAQLQAKDVLPHGAHLKIADGTAVLRIGARATEAAPGALRAAIAWVHGRPNIHTLRIETQSIDPKAFQRLISPESREVHFTQEDYYHFHTRAGQYDLRKRLQVATIALHTTRAQADAQAHTLTGADRAYAFQTLYFAGNKAYDQSAQAHAINLTSFLPQTYLSQPKGPLAFTQSAVAIPEAPSTLTLRFNARHADPIPHKVLLELPYTQLLALNVHFTDPRHQAQVLQNFEMSESQFQEELSAICAHFGVSSIESLKARYIHPDHFQYAVNAEINARRSLGKLDPVTQPRMTAPPTIAHAAPLDTLTHAQPTARFPTKASPDTPPVKPRYPSSPVELSQAGLTPMEAQALYQHLQVMSHSAPVSVDENARHRAIRKLGFHKLSQLPSQPEHINSLLNQLKPLLPTNQKTPTQSAADAARVMGQMSDEQLEIARLAALELNYEAIQAMTGKSIATIHRAVHPLVQAIDPTKYPKDLPALLDGLFSGLSASALFTQLKSDYTSWAQQHIPDFKPITGQALAKLSPTEFDALHTFLTTSNNGIPKPQASGQTEALNRLINRKNQALRRLGLTHGAIDLLYRNTPGGQSAFFDLLHAQRQHRRSPAGQIQANAQSTFNALRAHPSRVATLLDTLPRRAYQALLLQSQGLSALQTAQELSVSESTLKTIQRQIAETFKLPLDKLPQLFDGLYRADESHTELFERLLNNYSQWAGKHIAGYEPIESLPFVSVPRQQLGALYHALFGHQDNTFSPQAQGLKSVVSTDYAKKALNTLGVPNKDSLIKHYRGGLDALQAAMAAALHHQSVTTNPPPRLTTAPTPVKNKLPFHARAFDSLDSEQLYLLADLAAGMQSKDLSVLYEASAKDLDDRVKHLLSKWSISSIHELRLSYQGPFDAAIQKAIEARGSILADTAHDKLAKEDQLRLVWRLMQAGHTDKQIAMATGQNLQATQKLTAEMRNTGIAQMLGALPGLNRWQITELTQILQRGPERWGQTRWELNTIKNIIGKFIKPGVYYTRLHVWTLLLDNNLLELANLRKINTRKLAGFNSQQLQTLKQAIQDGPMAHGFDATRWDRQSLTQLFNRVAHKDDQHSYADYTMRAVLHRMGLSVSLAAERGNHGRPSPTQLDALRATLERGPSARGLNRRWRLDDVQSLIVELTGTRYGRDIAREIIDGMYPGGIRYVSATFLPKRTAEKEDLPSSITTSTGKGTNPSKGNSLNSIFDYLSVHTFRHRTLRDND